MNKQAKATTEAKAAKAAQAKAQKAERARIALEAKVQAKLDAQLANANEGEPEEGEPEADAVRFGSGKLRHASIAHYAAHEVNGRRVFDCGDAVAVAVRTMTLDELYEAASRHTGASEEELRQRYAKLNKGMQAMNLRNRLRARL